MRPNWSAAPEWAGYAAQELSGSWYFHELQPVYVEIVGEWRSKGRTQIVPKVSVQAKDTMEQRPQLSEWDRTTAHLFRCSHAQQE